MFTWHFHALQSLPWGSALGGGQVQGASSRATRVAVSDPLPSSPVLVSHIYVDAHFRHKKPQNAAGVARSLVLPNLFIFARTFDRKSKDSTLLFHSSIASISS